MKATKWTMIMQPAVALAMALACAAPQAALPEGEYACQVQTRGAAMGLVLVQADSLPEAEQMAQGAKATTSDGSSAAVDRVIECITLREERFTDSQFQQFFESLPG